ncbi:hypothetical protein [Clostridium sp. HBUAS56010]|nr:hypothetical protein [Clostridium sp. HBUAS56010]
MDKLEMLCQPLVEYLKENHNPHTEIVVTMDSIMVKQCAEGIPVKENK